MFRLIHQTSKNSKGLEMRTDWIDKEYFMSQTFPYLDVIETARICGVARSTVSYWISKKGLPAKKSGKKHLVAQDNLILFLKDHGYGVPEVLKKNKGMPFHSSLRAYKKCWEYWAQKSHGVTCRECNVFRYQLDECFIARLNSQRACPVDCHACQYYGEYYAPQVDFIYQIEKPSAVYKDLFLWAGNHSWAELFGISRECLIGIGIEEFIHPESLKMILNYDKRRKQGDTTVPDRYQAFFLESNGKKIKVNVLVSPLKRPSGTWLALIERIENSSGQEE